MLSAAAFLILSLKADIELLKHNQKALSAVLDVQLSWNRTSVRHDVVMDKRIDKLEQKMRKVYGGYSNITSGTGEVTWKGITDFKAYGSDIK